MKIPLHYLDDNGNDVEIVGEITYNSTPFIPARITSDPFHSHPAEGGDFEIEKIVDAETGEDVTDMFPDQDASIVAMVKEQLSGLL